VRAEMLDNLGHHSLATALPSKNFAATTPMPVLNRQLGAQVLQALVPNRDIEGGEGRQGRRDSGGPERTA
jgi:hypothetical protein